MDSNFVPPELVLQDLYEKETRELRAALAAATERTQRARIKHEIRCAKRRHRGVLRWLIPW